MHSSLKRLLTGFVLLSLFAAPTLAQGRNAPTLRQVESNYYTIHTNLDDDTLRPLAMHMDLLFEEFTRRFEEMRNNRPGYRPTMYLLNNRENYIATMRSLGIDASASGGMFFRNSRAEGLATWVNGLPPGRVRQVLQHEGFHQFAYNYIGRQLPLWANEGMAEYFEQALLINGRFRVGIAEPHRVRTIKRALERGHTVPFDELLNITSQQWRANMSNGSRRGSLQYTQSWSIVYFLVHGDDERYQAAFIYYLQLLNQGRSHRQAFGEAFGTTQTDGFRERWEAFVREMEPDPLTIATQRLEFLAQGVRWLIRNGHDVPPHLDGLRDSLREHNFSIQRRVGHNQSARVSAQDDEPFVYTDARGQTHAFELTASREPGLPPLLSAPRLNPNVHIVWTARQDPSRPPRFQVAYD